MKSFIKNSYLFFLLFVLLLSKNFIFSLFKNIYLCCLSKKDGCKKIYDLFDIKVDESTNITYELSKKMKKH